MELGDAELKELKKLMTANRGAFRLRTAKMAERFFEELLQAKNLAIVAAEAQRAAEARADGLERTCEALRAERDTLLAQLEAIKSKSKSKI